MRDSVKRSENKKIKGREDDRRVEESQENSEEIDAWSKEDIVKRYNANYSVDYDYRKLRDAFRKTLMELMEAYEREYKKDYGEDCNEVGDDESGFERLFTRKHIGKGQDKYCFFKLSENLIDSHGLLITYNKDEELDELCQMYNLCFAFMDKGHRTIRGMETLGLILKRRVEEHLDLLGENKKLWSKGEKIYRAMQCCIKEHLDTIERSIEEIRKLFRNLRKLEKTVEGVSAFQEKELRKVIARYSKDAIYEFRTWCVYSQSIAEIEQSQIRTYKSRGSVSGEEQKERTLQIVDTNINIVRDMERTQRERIFLDIHEKACQVVAERGVLEEGLAKEWEDAVKGAWAEIEKLDENMKIVLKRAFLRELAIWRERAEAFLDAMLRDCLLERTRYWIQNDRRSTFSWKKDTGAFSSSSDEEAFQKSREPESKEPFMARVWAQITEEWEW